jgi:hypothetical protein
MARFGFGSRLGAILVRRLFLTLFIQNDTVILFVFRHDRLPSGFNAQGLQAFTVVYRTQERFLEVRVL